MSRPKMKKSERLLRQMERVGSMSRVDMIKYLRRCEGKKYNPTRDANAYNSILYGTNKVDGILRTFCQKDLLSGNYQVVREIVAPFTPSKAQFGGPAPTQQQF